MRVRVMRFNGTSLSTHNSSSIMIAPPIPQADALRSWYDTTQDKDAHALNATQFFSAANSPCPKEKELFKSAHAALLSPENTTFWLKGQIRVEDFQQSFFYTGCNKCKKGTSKSTGIGFHCGECGAQGCVATERVSMAAEVVDASGKLPVLLFGPIAASFCGLSEKDLIDVIKSQDLPGNRNLLQSLFQSASEKVWCIQVNTSRSSNMSAEQRFYVFSLKECEAKESALIEKPPVKRLKFSDQNDKIIEIHAEIGDLETTPDEVELTPPTVTDEKVNRESSIGKGKVVESTPTIETGEIADDIPLKKLIKVKKETSGRPSKKGTSAGLHHSSDPTSVKNSID